MGNEKAVPVGNGPIFEDLVRGDLFLPRAFLI
jgi:hypothetical protein